MHVPLKERCRLLGGMKRACPRILALWLFLAGCAGGAAVEDLRDRDWRLVAVTGFQSIPDGATTPTARFATDGRFAANTGCNSAGAAYTVEGDRLTIRPLLATKRACADPEGNSLESAYLEAIEQTRSFRIANDRLELLSGEGTVVAQFR